MQVLIVAVAYLTQTHYPLILIQSRTILKSKLMLLSCPQQVVPVHPSIMIINKILANPPCRRPNSPASTPSKLNQYFSPANESRHKKIASKAYIFLSILVFVLILFKCGMFWFSLPVLVGSCGCASISVCRAAAPGGVSPVSFCRLQLSPTVASRHRSILEPAASRSQNAARCWSLFPATFIYRSVFYRKQIEWVLTQFMNNNLPW